MTRNELQEFTEGYDSAILKEPLSVRKKPQAWVRGYERGKEAVEFHKRLLTRRSTFDWFNNLGKRSGGVV